MAQKKAVSAKKKSPRDKVVLEINLGQLPASKTQISSLKKALRNEVLTWVSSDRPGETPPIIVCEEFRKPPGHGGRR